MNKRKAEILNLVPKEVRTILDIGSGGELFKDLKGTKTTTLNIEGADIVQDLEKKQSLDLKDSSFDLVVLSQILEHLTHVEEIIRECKRVSKKYILVGLPNELKLDNRIGFLFGIYKGWGELVEGYYPQGHKHFFLIRSAENFVRHFFGDYVRRKYIFGIKGGKYLSYGVRDFLCRLMPTLFCGQVYYLIQTKHL